MPIQIIRNDITKVHADAIVNAANSALAPGGGVCGAIHQAAGSELALECKALGGCATGRARITKGYRLPCRYVIHAVGPVWNGGWRGEDQLLASCYRESLALAVQYHCQSIAFPLISSGVYGYPRAQALKIATDAIRDFLLGLEEDLLVLIVIFDKESFQISEKLYAGVSAFIDDYYADAHLAGDRRARFMQERQIRESMEAARCNEDAGFFPCFAPKAPDAFSMGSLEDALQELDESFSQMVLRKIDEKGMTDPECYKRANLSRKLFSKIRGDIHYQPSKRTALALAISLELSLPETELLLRKAGMALSHSSKFDVIIEYFIRNGHYNLFEINETLFQFDQMLLGG